jgi:ribosomal-protein-alanine N-acetyltransferase
LSDLTAVLAIEQQSFPTPARQKTYRYELTANKLAHYQALLIAQPAGDEQLIGYAGYWLMAGEVHISTLAVDPRFRRRGLGELILLNVLHLAQDHQAHLVTLEVRAGNQAAQELYKKYAFEIVGHRRRYYKDTGEDAILMTAVLRDNQPYLDFLAEQQRQLFILLAGAPFFN